ncbi:MAG: T9SS type A sorting domain-containing protein [Bacteroidales bacterium]|jgi:hypothetical protein|nr:T9SS type A sorting domain-containing protein [Bacteroidales bacterium]
MTGDLNSVVEKTYFVDATNTLQPASNHGLSCPTLTGIVDDNINGTPRPTSTTMMGAYDFTPVSVDIHPASLSLSTNNVSVGTQTDINIILHNAGTTTADSVDIYWAINGQITTNPYRWKGTLTAGTSSSVVTAGNFNPVSGTNNIIVWTKPADGTTDNNLSNDTVKTAIYACDTALNGTYTIGTGGKFATMQDALFTLKTCGMNGAVRFEFLPNEIHAASFELTSISGLSAVNTITLTSQSGSAANTVLLAKKDMNVITLNGSPYIKISNLTLNARTGKRGIEMIGALPNIEISNCIILLDTLTTAEGDGKAGIYHSSGSANNLTDFRVTNNIIDGGYSAIHIVSNGSNRVCDSNIITNSGYRAIWCWGTGSTKNSISHNTIISRRENSAATWHGILLNNGDLDKVEGNKIRTLSNQIPTVRGIEMQSVTGGDRNFINNEICIRSSTAGYGIGASNVINSLYHNSIYVESNGANALNFTAKPTNISYNNLIAGTSADVAIYISTNINDINMDYNNYYGVGNICRLGGTNYASLANWQLATQKDIHSVSILPNFLDINTSLEYADTSALYCPVFSFVREDINKQIRTTPTNIGAYGFTTNNLDMELSQLYNIPPSIAITIGQTLNPKLIVTNTGLALLDSANIYWECNGVGQNVRWNNNPLASLANDTIDLGTFAISQAGSYHLLIYATSVNNAATDMNQKNDTIRMSLLVCDSALSGAYVVGNTGVFSTITDAINQLHTCGVSNDVQFTLQNGIYSENIDLSELKDIFGSYKLDIVSASNIADSVIIQPSGNNNPVVLLGNSNNITLNAITIDATKSRSHGIEFVDSCTNISVYGCRFFADTVSAVNGNQCIYTGVNDNDYLSAITIENNILCGGFEGINMGIAKSSGIKISHNLLYNQSASGISLKNVNGANNKISFNTIRSRIANSNATWTGIAIEGSNISINGNKIHQQDITVQTMYGIQLFYGYSGLVSNNEIIGFANSDAKGISVDLSSVNLLHNSIYLYGNAVQNGIFTAASDASSGVKIHRNNIVLTSASGYPISMTENIATIKDINTNNYYAPNFIGRITSDFSTVYPVYIEYRSLPVWRVDVPTDVASVQVEPKFVDVSQSLNLADYTGLYCAKIADIPNDINDSSRTHPTTIGAYGLDILTNYDLSLTQIVDPANDLTSMCAPNHVAVRYALCNTGIATYDFSKDTVSLYFEVKGMKGDFDTVVLVTADSLALMETDTFELMNLLDVSFAGDYHITAWISSEKDTLHANDTLRMIYRTNKIALPYEETFSASQPDLFIDNVVGTNGWQVVQGSDAIISPNVGTGMLVLGAYHGTISTIKIGQIELERTAQPKLEFWYAHDNSEPNKRDQMTVRVSWNSGLSEKIVHQIKRYDASYTTPNWVKYTVDLSPYVDSVCVAVSLEAISYGGIQHIDRITVTSNQNLALDTVLVSDYSLCDLNNKNISLALANTTNQRINYAVTPTNIIVKVRGLITKDTIIVLSGAMEGSEKDTILIADNLDLQKGTYAVNAFISSPVSDIDRKDDTIQRTISINPRLVPHIDPVSGGSSNCLSGEMDIFPVINLTNTGNVDISDIELVLQIDTGGTNDPAYIILTDTCTDTIHAGKNLSYSFKSSYKVPWSPDIYARITARLLCNPALIDTSTAITECIDMKDLYLVSIDNPSSATTDKVGESIQVKVTLSNRYDLRGFSNTDITVLVTNSQGVQMAKFTETKDIGILATTEHLFSRSYTVPNDTIYHLTVYTNSYDNYPYNDTITLKRNTVGVGIKSTEEMRGFTLGQNTPNPANGITRIDYSVPESGQIIFHIHSISGQLLHSETIEIKRGTHSLELNTATFAAGVYFYSMEYKGQRLIKQLIINSTN